MLFDINSDFGVNGAPFIVYGQDAIRNMVNNLLRKSPMSDRFEYILEGIELESLLKEPSDANATMIYMIIIEGLRYNMPALKLNLSQSSVILNRDTAEYDVTLSIDDQNVSFSL